MWPILLASVMATAIVIERFWSLQRKRVLPEQLVAELWQSLRKGSFNDEQLEQLRG